jgi:nicotinate-nucleotide adenylyltransferase
MTIPLRIGLLGGSFNPAHEGHLHISLEAIRQLGLDQVWWLVSPQNPLKPTQDMAEYAKRFASAQKVARHEKKIIVSDFEKHYGLQYTYATLAALKKHCPGIKFIWIMGADNLASFHRWQRWRSIIKIMPIVVFDRAPFSHIALRTRAAIAMKHLRLPENRIAAIANSKNRWVYMYILARKHPASSTQIRAHGPRRGL